MPDFPVPVRHDDGYEGICLANQSGQHQHGIGSWAVTNLESSPREILESYSVNCVLR